MTLNPTFQVSIDRSLMPGSLSPLILSGNVDAEPLGVYEFVPPSKIARMGLTLSDEHIHGDYPLRWSLQQATLQLSLAPDANDAATAQSLLREVEAAIHQGLRFPVTTTESDADPEIWTCNPGSLVQTARTIAELTHHDPLWALTLPCHPVPG